MKRAVAFAFILAVAICLCPGSTQADTDRQQKALKLAQEGIRLVDSGKPDEAVVLLDSAIQLDPDNILYPYEKAYVYSTMKRYQDAVDLLEVLVERDDATDDFYQLLGGCYDYLGKTENALTLYSDGLKRFPKSGKLYAEAGITHMRSGDSEKALQSFERGISANPTYASNYYHATRILASVDERLWALMYGEVFLNLERNSRRSYEMSKLLYDTYNAAISVSGDSSARVVLNPTQTLSLEDLNHGGGFQPGFEMMFELNTTIALAPIVASKGGQCSVQPLPIACIAKLREACIAMWVESRHHENYPNALLRWHKALSDKGYLTVYSYWMLNQGNED